MKGFAKKITALVMSFAMLTAYAISPAPVSAETEYNPKAGTWKFDFGSGEVEAGYIGVSADKRYTDGLDYGFIGITEDDYKFKAGSYMDSFTTVQGQKIELENGTGNGAGANSDFVAAKKGTEVTTPTDFYNYTTANPIRFSMAAENGGYYHVKVTLANSSATEKAKVSLFAERRHQLLTDAEIEAGGTLTYEFNVDVETVYFKSLNGNYTDDSISIEVTGVNAAIASMEVEKLETGTTLWLMGDSTGCDQNAGYPYFPLQNYAGTGQGLTKYLPKDIALSNHGDGGIYSGDNNHYKNVKANIKPGDYLYAEWGHNEKSPENYVSNMERYYKDCVEKGANLIVVGPIDRSGDKQFNKETGKWSSTLNAYSEAGKKFVDEKLAEGAKNIAFVDINAGWIDFLDNATDRFETVTGSANDFQSVKFYYKSDKSGLVENSHENDAGADNAADIFFTEAKNAVAAGEAAGATEAEKAQAAVLKGIVTGMRGNTPYTVPETILKGGNVINKKLENVYYPAVVTENFDGKPAAVKKVNIVDDKIESITVKMEHYTGLSSVGTTYALAVAEVYGTQTSSSLSSKYDVTNGNGTFTLSFDEPVALTDGTYTVWLQGLNDDTQQVETSDNYRFSEKFTQDDVSDIEEYLIGDYDDVEIPDTFEYYGVKTGSDIKGNNDWLYEGSSTQQTTTLENDGQNGEHSSYLKISKTATGGSYYLYKAFPTKAGDGKIVFDTDIYYESGSMEFWYSDGKRSMADNASVKCFTVGNNAVTSDGGVSFGITPNTWTHITYSLNYDTAEAELKVGNAEAQTYNVDKLDTILVDSFQPSTVGSILINIPTNSLAGARLDNLAVKKYVPEELGTKTVSVTAGDNGSASIQGETSNSVAVPMNSTLTLVATPAEGYRFSQWIDTETETAVSSVSPLKVRAHEDISLRAEFAEASTLLSEDFEGTSHSFTANGTAVWDEDTSPKNKNETKIYGIKAGTNAYAYWTASETIKEKATLSLDFRLDAAGKGGTTEFIIGEDCTSGNASKKLIDIKMTTNSGTNMVADVVTLNDVDIAEKMLVAGERYDANSGSRNGSGWIHMELVPDFENNTADITLTRMSDNTTVYENKTLSFVDTGITGLGSIILQAPTGSMGGVYIDNVVITPEETEEPEPSASPEPSESPSPSQSAEPTASASPSQEPSASPTASASPEPSESPSLSPSAEPSASPTATATVTASPSPTATASASPEPTNEPIGPYSCDFTKLVKNNAKTDYGNAGDIIKIDDYTTAYLTYEGTYVDADGKVYLKSGTITNGSGHANKGSYIAFTAPSSGTLVVTGADLGWYKDNNYGGSGATITISDVVEGVTYYFGYRKGTTYIDSLTFEPTAAPPVYEEVDEYDRVAKETMWDFDEKGPATEGYNKPVISGTAEYDRANKNIKFNSANTTSGALTVDFDKPVKNNVKIEFDTHMAELGQQNFIYSVKDSEGNELVYCTFDQYNKSGELRVGGIKVAEAGDFASAISSNRGDGMGAAATRFGITLDFYALNAVIDIGSKSYTASLPEETTKDVDIVKIESTRSKTGRDIYVDNLKISEFDSTASPAPAPQIANGYSEGEYNGMPYRMSRPKTAGEYPLVVYLHSSARNGNDNYSQLYQAQYLFNQLKDKAILVTPQTADTWNANDVAGLIDSLILSEQEDEKPELSGGRVGLVYDANSNTLTLTAPDEELNSAVVIKAAYNDNAMTGVKLYPVNFADKTVVVNNIEILENERVYVWDSADGMKPLSDVFTLSDNATGEKRINTDKIYLAGQGDGADAALAIAAACPDKFAAVIAAAPTAAMTDEDIAAMGRANTASYIFAEYVSVDIENVRKTVNGLQSAGIVDTMYTEYPFAQSNIAKAAAETTGLVDWLLSQSLTANAAEKSEKKVVDLVLFAGQSNMAGRGEYDEAIECPPGHGFEYHSVTEPGVLSTLSEPFGKYENNDTVNDNGGDGLDRRAGDMVSSFMESYYQNSGVPIVGVQCSRGGERVSYFTARTDEMIARYSEAEKYLTDNGYTIGKKFIVWCQGCSDADKDTNLDTYKADTKSIYTTLKNSVGITDMFIVRIGHRNGNDTEDAKYKKFNLAQKALADETDGITAVASLYTDEYFAQMRDAYHYHQPVYNSVGTIAGNNTAYTLYGKGAWTAYPEPDGSVITPEPAKGVFEITSSEASVDVSSLKTYDSSTYRMYKPDGSYETVTAANSVIANNTGGEVTIVPEYKFEFTNQTNPTDENIAGYVKVAQGSYTAEKGYGLTSENYSINANGCKADSNPIKVILADGFYDVTVYRLGGGRADIYSKGQLIANNTTSATAQNRGGASALMEIPAVKLSDGSADITFGNLSGNNERIASLKIVRVPEKYRKPVIWIAGDSESSDYYPFDIDGDDLDSDKIMITGFGQQLSKVLSDKYAISNYGQPSATVKTWYDECFESVNNLMQSGDTILIDFGINEVASSSNKLTKEQMQEHMKLIIDAAKENGVTPILVSPVYNGKYQHRSYFTYDAATQTNAMYAFAEETGIDYIDLNKWTQLYVNKAIEETGDASWRTNNYQVSDDLHLTQHSALLAASFIAAAMEEMGYETSDYSYTYSDISAVLEGNLRGEKNDNQRVYGTAAAKTFVSDGTIVKP
ncbi:MAG: hypothetical protein J1F01_03785 [Oscillospiraceae bacterium]|nr:hypothetical protein [Oscillospiraceae bacterium]